MVLWKAPDFDSRWKRIRRTVSAILEGTHVPRRAWCSTFFYVHALFNASQDVDSVAMVERLHAETQQLLIDHMATLLVKIQQDGDDKIIANYDHHWRQYLKAADLIRTLFSHRDVFLESIEVTCEGNRIYKIAMDTWQVGILIPMGGKIVELLEGVVAKNQSRQAPRIPVELETWQVGILVPLRSRIMDLLKQVDKNTSRQDRPIPLATARSLKDSFAQVYNADQCIVKQFQLLLKYSKNLPVIMF